VKVRVPLNKPASEAPWGFVLEPALGTEDGLVLRPIAFGERHPIQRWSRSVYERAHRRLHGRYPDQ